MSNEGTINPIICRVPAGLSFKLLSQTMAGHIPCQVFQRDSDRAPGQIGLRWPALWDSPLMTYPLQGGSLGTLPRPWSSALEDLFAPKAKRDATVVAAGGYWPGSRKPGLQEPMLPCLLLWPWQLTRSCESGHCGGRQEPLYLGEKGRCPAPPPPWLSQNPRCRWSCCSLFPSSCCLSVSMTTRPTD